ncbi:MAG: NAD(+) synthase [Bacteroidales bacterium]|jgi:NAD+ synthase (glutamine-hydrolysing)|nr:NAD(+) synthase [Bacteroidales bacterium]MCI1786156.1 NAD(+) synthase [Bacteroidales bacterium]
MTDFGFIRVAAAVPRVKVADVNANMLEICGMIEEAENKEISLLVFPELSVTGYTCGDLFGQNILIESAEKAVTYIKKQTRGRHSTVIIGAPVRFNDRLYNCAIVLRNGAVKGIIPKIYLPSYGEYYESRWFSSGSDFLSKESGTGGVFLSNGKDTVREAFGGDIEYAGCRTNISPNMLFKIGKATVGIEICEDLWTPVPPSSYHAMAGAQIIANLSASNEVIMKHLYRKSLVAQQSARTISGYIYCSCGYGESTQDMVYAGSSMIYENGSLMNENDRFLTSKSMIVADIDIEKLKTLRQKESTFMSISPDGTKSSEYYNRYSRISTGDAAETDFSKILFRHIEAHPFVPEGNPSEIDRRCKEITSIQVTGLATRLAKIGCKTAVIGISGGLDSTLALIISVMAFDKLGWSRKRITGITMPGMGTTDRTKTNASCLMEILGITTKEISIVEAVRQHFEDIGQNPEQHDVTYENAQARERTQILMDVANKENGMVIGTGDLSELALGWATYNGDHMSMYAVNASIPKTLVKHIVQWAAKDEFGKQSGGGKTVKDILCDIIDTPISPELIPAENDGTIKQKTEDLIGPYELHDFFLYNMFRFGYSSSKLYFLACKAFDGKYDCDTIEKWLKIFIKRFFSQQFKRSCMPDSPKVGSVTLSPRGDWRMPSDASVDLFL